MTFCIVGAGAVGRFMAASISRVAPTFIIPLRGGEIELPITVDGAASFASDNLKVISGNLMPSNSVVIFCIKSNMLSSCLDLLQTNFGGAREVLCIQNGIGIIEQMASFMPNPTICRRALVYGGVLSEGGVIKLANKFKMVVERGTTTSTVEVLNKAEMSISFTEDIKRAEWEKLGANLCVNSLCTIYKVPNRELIKNQTLLEVAIRILSEVSLVADAKGIKNLSLDETFIRNVVSMSASNLNSTLMEYNAGRSPLEYHSFSEFFLNSADNVNIKTPVTRAVSSLLKGMTN